MQNANKWQTEYEGNSDYVNHAYLKGTKNKSPLAIKLVLINKMLKMLKPLTTPSQLEKLTTLIWDISVASWEQGKGE